MRFIPAWKRGNSLLTFDPNLNRLGQQFIKTKAVKRASKLRLGGTENGEKWEPRAYIVAEWTSELQGESATINRGNRVACAGVATVIRVEGIAHRSPCPN